MADVSFNFRSDQAWFEHWGLEESWDHSLSSDCRVWHHRAGRVAEVSCVQSLRVPLFLTREGQGRQTEEERENTTRGVWEVEMWHPARGPEARAAQVLTALSLASREPQKKLGKTDRAASFPVTVTALNFLHFHKTCPQWALQFHSQKCHYFIIYLFGGGVSRQGSLCPVL